jgi:hypothetical protein
MGHWTERWWRNLILILFAWRKFLSGDQHNLYSSPSITGMIKSNSMRSISCLFKLLCFVCPCQMVIEFEGCDMFPWRLCAPPLHPTPSMHCQLRWIVIRTQATDWPTDYTLLTDSRGRFQSHHMFYVFIFLDHVVHEWVYFVGEVGEGFLFERKQICNFVLFCRALTNCRIPDFIVLAGLECYWFVQQLDKSGLVCSVICDTDSTDTWLSCKDFFVCISELWGGNVVTRPQAGRLRNRYSVPRSGSEIFLFSKKGQAGSGSQPLFYSVGAAGSFPRGKAAGALGLPLTFI